MLENADLSILADVLIEIISNYFVLCIIFYYFYQSSFFFPFSYCNQNVRYDENF